MTRTVVSLVINNFTNDSRVSKEANSIAAMGHTVKIVALHERGLVEHESCENYTIHRVKLWTKNWGKSKFIQLLKYIELFIRVVALYRKVDIVHSHDLSALPIGCAIKFTSYSNIKLIYDAHEYAINDLPFESKFRQMIKKRIESFFIIWVDSLITVSDGIADLYEKVYGLSSKPSVVLNCPLFIPRVSSNILKEKLSLPKETYVFLYQGALTNGRGIQYLIDSFKKIDDANLALIFMGFGELVGMIESQEDERIFYVPAVSPFDLAFYTASADCGVALIEDSCLSYRYCLPNKIFEYFMAGLPVIASDLPEMRKVINEYDVGALCSLGKPSDIEEAMKAVRCFDNAILDINLKKINKKFNWQNQEKVLRTVYESI
tara:strand:+ start:864 stop:1991 length:1128 start_codon:yes stop_codon:yes gene_type:complete